MTRSEEAKPAYTGPVQTYYCAGLLIDFDGTIVDSTEAIIKHWHSVGEDIGIDPDVILASSHGRRSIDLFKLYDPSKANWDYVRHLEGQIPSKFGSDAVEIPGARAFLQSLEDGNVPWAIVTSGTRPLMTAWLEVMKLAHPKNSVVAEDVEIGKPDPACYLLGKDRLRLGGQDPILVLEDAPAGIRAGQAAGCKVVGLATTHQLDIIKETGPNWIVRDLQSVKYAGRDEKTGLFKMEIHNSLLQE